MTEFLNPGRIDNLQVDHSLADRAISTFVDSYESTLTNGVLKEFRELDDVSEKVNKVCYVLAANPETRAKAVNLRSWHIVRLLTRHFANIEPGNEWAYTISGISSSDDFDRLVYPTAEALLKRTAQVDLNLSPVYNLADYDPEKNTLEQVILADDNKAILKREWCYLNTREPHTAAYVVKAI